MVGERKTIGQFAIDHKLRMICNPTDHNPNLEDSATMDHWKCEIRSAERDKKMTVTFSRGPAFAGAAPPIDEVLSCLASDSASTEESFEDWCASLGYDSDSRKAERTYNVCVKQAEKLKNLLGDEAYEELLYQTEPL